MPNEIIHEEIETWLAAAVHEQAPDNVCYDWQLGDKAEKLRCLVAAELALAVHAKLDLGQHVIGLHDDAREDFLAVGRIGYANRGRFEHRWRRLWHSTAS